MNTVESLKKLYKTMAGKDWPYDPNPTDAEVIDKIAADATGSGGGSGLLEIVFQMDLTNASSLVDMDNIGFAISISKEEAIALGKRSTNCVACLDIINPNNVSLSGELSSGRYNGVLCKIVYSRELPKVDTQPEEEYLSLMPYCISNGDNTVALPAIPLLDYDTTQHDVWTNIADMRTAFNSLFLQVSG